MDEQTHSDANVLSLPRSSGRLLVPTQASRMLAIPPEKSNSLSTKPFECRKLWVPPGPTLLDGPNPLHPLSHPAHPRIPARHRITAHTPYSSSLDSHASPRDTLALDMTHALALSILPGSYCICKLAPADMASTWIAELFDSERSSFSCFTRTSAELSLVCEQKWPPATIRREADFAIIKLGDQFDFQQIGLFLSIAKPLADANISILPIATFDTDYVLIKQTDMPAALDALLAAGHSIA